MSVNLFFKPMAYLDPGTGSLVIQLVLAGLLGVAVVVRAYWKKIAVLLKRGKRDNVQEFLDDLDEHGVEIDNDNENV